MSGWPWSFMLGRACLLWNWCVALAQKYCLVLCATWQTIVQGFCLWEYISWLFRGVELIYMHSRITVYILQWAEFCQGQPSCRRDPVLCGKGTLRTFGNQASVHLPNNNAMNWRSYSFARSTGKHSAYLEYGELQRDVTLWLEWLGRTVLARLSLPKPTHHTLCVCRACLYA